MIAYFLMAALYLALAALIAVDVLFFINGC